MNRLVFAALGLLLGSVLAGCSQTDSTPPSNTQNTLRDVKYDVAASGNQGIPANLDPKQTIVHYLQAVKEGNQQQVAGLLTEVARRKTTEARISVAPPGSDTAVFSVGNMEFVTPDRKTAHVASIWTDVDDQEKPQTLNIVWVVRQEAAGWRVAGMITKIAADQPMLVLNFEEPEEVIRRSEEELARNQSAKKPAAQADGGNPLADAPANSAGSEPRQARGPADGESNSPR